MDGIDIKDFLKYLKKFILPMAIIAILATGGSIFYNLKVKKPLYRTSTTIVLAQKADDANNSSINTLNDINVSQKLVSTYSQIIKSKLVLDQVISELSLSETADSLSKHVTVTAVEGTEIIKIAVEDGNHVLAAQIANKIADVFMKKIVNIYQLNNVSVIDAAQANAAQSNNTTVRDAAIAALLSVFGVVALAAVIYYFDDTIKYSENLESQISMPIASKIFKSDIDIDKNGDELLVDKYPKSIVSESIKSLRTNLQFSNIDNDLKTILVTSANAR